MGQSTGIEVIKHDVTAGTSPTTRTFLHSGSRGGRNFSVAIRGDLPAADDYFQVTIKQRIPGRDSDENAADYYDDEPVPLWGGATSVGQEKLLATANPSFIGKKIGNTHYVAAGTGKQLVINAYWPPGCSDIVIEVTEDDTAVLKALTSWEVA